MEIYIHVPFCETKCPYCAFGSFSDKFGLVKRYFESLKIELKHHLLNLDEKISTIFIGGGTPSSIESGFYNEIFEILSPRLSKNCEITSEANPNSSSLKWLENMYKFGVNRMSFGVQSFEQKKLEFLGRIHTSDMALEAVKKAKSVGFKNINIDLIYDTKFDSKKLIKYELDNISTLNITHISAYSLTLEQNTPFENKINYKKDSTNLAKFLISGLKELGYLQYEISNFGKPCKHNLGYWSQKDYLGIGAYAVGMIKNKRFYSPKNVEEYIKNPLKKYVENLKKDEILHEHIFLGLRSNLGVKISLLNENQIKKLNILKENGKIYIEKNRAFNRNYLLSDEVYLYLTSF